jgi:trans-aconitate methyltransferase
VLVNGCSTGFPNANYLSTRGFHVTGIDASSAMIMAAKKNSIPNADFILSDFSDFKPEQHFDGILAWDSFFHFQNKKQRMIYPTLRKF